MAKICLFVLIIFVITTTVLAQISTETNTTETTFLETETEVLIKSTLSTDILEKSTRNDSLTDTTTLSAEVVSTRDRAVLQRSEKRGNRLSKATTVSPAEEETKPAPNRTVVQKWEMFETNTRKFFQATVKRILPMLMKGSGSLNISTNCIKDTMKILGGLREIKPWAFSFIDSSGKLIDGLLTGNMANMGEYDQCVETEAINERKGRDYGKVMFRGQYCALDIKPPLPPKKDDYYKINEVISELKNISERGTIISEAAKTAHLFYLLSTRIGICVPTGCSKSDIAQVVTAATKLAELSVTVRRCEIKEEPKYTPVIIGVITVCSFFGFLMLIGSLVDIYHYYTQKKVYSLGLKILVAFSLISNFKKFVNTESSKSKLSCFNGLRFLSMTWIILGHSYLNINLQLFRGLRTALEFPKDFAFQAVINASVAVDTFFFMSGFLVCYLTVKLTRETKKPFNIWLYIFHRLMRILPMYLLVIAFMFLAPLFGRGPVWHDTTDVFVNACYENWWTNLIFINNFYHADNICLPQSWFIACDIQLYIAALIVLLPLLRWPKVGISIAVLGALASMIGTGAMTYVKNYPPTMLFVHPDHDQRIQYWANAYFKPYSHAGPYCIGMIIGYLLITKPNLRFSLTTRVIGWCLAIICNTSVLYGVWEWNKGVDPNLVETLLYSSCHRVAWTLGVAWVVINCATGQGGVVNYILTWKTFVVLGRLTYAAYLIHPIVQLAAVGNLRMKLMPWHYFAVWMYSGHLFITYTSSFAASMLIEAPGLSLEKVFLRNRKLIPENLPTDFKTLNSTDLNCTANNRCHKPTEPFSNDKEYVCHL